MSTYNTSIQARLAHSPISQERLAQVLGVSGAYLSRLIRGLRPMPEGFEERVHAVLDLHERAERAAQAARERVLAEEEGTQ